MAQRKEYTPAHGTLVPPSRQPEREPSQADSAGRAMPPISRVIDPVMHAAQLRRLAGSPVQTALAARQLQRSLGNRYVAQLATGMQPDRPAGLIVQPKLTVTAPDDRYEQEADRVADAVMSQLGGGAIQRSPGAQLPPVQPAGVAIVSDGVAVAPALEAEISLARSEGQPLPAHTRAAMETAIGAGFGGVRIHTGSQAHALSEALDARAFTTGQDIFFRQGEFQPESATGQRLLAHELAHVVQQAASGPAAASRMVQCKTIKAGYQGGRFEANTNDVEEFKRAVDTRIAGLSREHKLGWLGAILREWTPGVGADDNERSAYDWIMSKQTQIREDRNIFAKLADKALDIAAEKLQARAEEHNATFVAYLEYLEKHGPRGATGIKAVKYPRSMSQGIGSIVHETTYNTLVDNCEKYDAALGHLESLLASYKTELERKNGDDPMRQQARGKMQPYLDEATRLGHVIRMDCNAWNDSYAARKREGRVADNDREKEHIVRAVRTGLRLHEDNMHRYTRQIHTTTTLQPLSPMFFY